MRNIADVSGGNPIAVFLQSISGVSGINPLGALYDIHGGKREVLFVYFVPDTTQDNVYSQHNKQFLRLIIDWAHWAVYSPATRSRVRCHTLGTDICVHEHVCSVLGLGVFYLYYAYTVTFNLYEKTKIRVHKNMYVSK
jgi:hypothetical protein